MTKPFDLGELIARSRALIRRSRGTAEPILRFGDLVVHTTEQTVLQGNDKVDLSPTEYRILEYLMFRPRVIVSKRELLEHLYDFTWEHHSNVIEAHVPTCARSCDPGVSGRSWRPCVAAATGLRPDERPMKSRSLTRQIVGIVFVAQVLCALLLATTAIFDETHTHLRAFDVRLQGRSDPCSVRFRMPKTPTRLSRWTPMSCGSRRKMSSRYTTGRLDAGQSAGAPSELTARGANGFRSVRFHGVRYRVLQREALRIIDRSEVRQSRTSASGNHRVCFASDARLARDFESLRLSLITIFVAAALTREASSFFLRRALRPLSDLETAAASISPPITRLRSSRFRPKDSRAATPGQRAQRGGTSGCARHSRKSSASSAMRRTS